MLAEAAVDNMVLLHLQDLEDLVVAVLVLNNVDLLDPMLEIRTQVEVEVELETLLAQLADQVLLF